MCAKSIADKVIAQLNRIRGQPTKTAEKALLSSTRSNDG